MLIDYWLASCAAQGWLRIRKGSRPGADDTPRLCRDVAQGSALPAGTLWRVQDFAATLWWVAAMVVVMMVVAGLALSMAFNGPLPIAVVAGVFGTVFPFGMGVTATQAIVGQYRRNRITLYLRKAGGAARLRPLPPGSPGLPRRSDFWLALAVGVALMVIFLWGLLGG